MGFSRETVAAIKEQADILQVIGSKVALAPSGANYKGLCPFHGEKTPSFMVNPARRMYHCFGCDAGGSVVDFVMAYERLEFPQAVQALAERFGIALPGERDRPDPTAGALRALQVAQAYHHDLLLNKPQGEGARAYLRKRSLEASAWKAFGLGYASEGWRNLISHAQGQGVALPDLLAAGLARQGNGGQPYDLMRARVLMPIQDVRLRCIAFGGRVLEGAEGPKYLNTPETALYHKSQTLFGLAQGQEAIRKGRQAILVEGYLDVMRLHLNGYPQAVATCGTALTPDHLKLLERYAQRVVLLFDGDVAGIKAALRSAPLFLNRGMEAGVVVLPDGLDPDEFILERGAEAFAERMARPTPLLEFLVTGTASQHGRTLEGKERTVQALLPLLAQVQKDTTREMTLHHLAELVGVRPESLGAQMAAEGARRPARGGAIRAPDAAQTRAVARVAGEQRRELHHQQLALRLLLRHPQLLPVARELLRPEELTEPGLQALYEALLQRAEAGERVLDVEELQAQQPALEPTVRSLLMEEPLGMRREDSQGRPGLQDQQRALQAEIARIKHGEKERLLQQVRRASGTPEEDLAVRRYVRLRNELRGMLHGPSPVRQS